MVVILLLVPSSSSSSLTTTTYTNSVSISQPKYHFTNSSSEHNRTPLHSSKYYCYGSQPLTHHQSYINTRPSTSSNANRNNYNYNREYVNHITRINISNDFDPQIEASNSEPEAIVKEGEFEFLIYHFKSDLRIEICSFLVFPYEIFVVSLMNF